MNFTIREMNNEDIKPIQAIAQKSWNATYEGIIPEEIQNNFLAMAYSDEMMQQRLKHSFMYVAEMESEIYGFANFTPVDEKGLSELSAIYLNPDHQNKGMGTALLDKGIQNIEGLKEIRLEVEKENKIGMQFYKAKGFKVVKEYDEDFDGHILKTVIMNLEL
ncbi:GNAT family N-acetyltransferase [Lacicoccus qingdaonensis]|uniref:L-amino acid N-acyltransferase YncA n=1 Tax=Lacicoccus qingdaonensis TaxID=576118 RepID=A0A1G9GLL7_9BACL|nr:GNAT family N-acetyltransferase [Salinicoccus qingdaonensis]SDL01554.1 L-amino acid N-acyltransferase YncA [Salinicoccus qingdaonensis]